MSPPILTVAETGSTNADLLELARDGGAEDGMWLRAERQTAGRGRQGRAWTSPAGNLYASTLARLQPGDPPAATLALVAGVALAAASRMVGDERATIKWPNDLLIDGAKAAGILLERAGDWVVIGFGVNLAKAPDVDGRQIARIADVEAAELLEVLAGEMTRWRACWRQEGVAAIAAAWSARAHPVGTLLRVRLGDGDEVCGVFDGLDASGALRLRLVDGESRVIHAGDVFLV